MNDMNSITILADDGVDSTEFLELWDIFTEHGAEVRLISVYPAQVLALDARGSVTRLRADRCLHEATADHGALVVPSGRGPHEQLRHHGLATALIRRTVANGGIVATGHRAAGVLIPAGAARGRRVTSASHLRSELEGAGARWADVAVAQDRGVLTTRHPGTASLAAAALDALGPAEGPALANLVLPPPGDVRSEPARSVTVGATS